MKTFEKFLKKSSLFKDTVLAIGNISKTVNDLVKGYTQLAKMVIEDRQAVNDLFALHSDMLLERESRERVVTPVKPASQKSSLEVGPMFAERENEKKKVLN